MTMVDEGATPLVDLLHKMTEASAEASTFDPSLQVLLRFAGLVALDADTASYISQLAAGDDPGLTAEDAQQLLITLAPVVGTARIVSATSKIGQALGLALTVEAGEAVADGPGPEYPVERGGYLEPGPPPPGPGWGPGGAAPAAGPGWGHGGSG